MIGQFTNLNWISILIAVVAYSLLGALWFTFLFSKQYKASLGRDHETLPNKPNLFIAKIHRMFDYVG